MPIVRGFFLRLAAAVVSDGSKVQLFDRAGMMSIDGRIVEG